VGKRLIETLGLPPLVWTSYGQSADHQAQNASAYEGVVGYGAGLTVEASNALSPPQKKALLTLARQTLEHVLEGKPAPEIPVIPLERGVFVTLTIHGMLRGCVGTLKADGPLAQAVVKFVKEAAFHDSRFPPIRANELDKVKIEISILNPQHPVASFQDIVPDQDGAVAEHGGKEGVFLPEVWNDMSRKTFFQELCRQKAGLSSHCYQNPETKLFGFSSDKFQE
jgi:AmmeMemoRadiSam system protein A